jgi:FdhE protein
MTAAKWDLRLRRARELATAYPSAAEGLRFYEAIAGFQQSFYASLEAESGPGKQERPPGSLREELELPRLLPGFPRFLALAQEIAPPPLARKAAQLEAARWEGVLADVWRETGTLDPAEALLAWAFLQPYAEHLADHTEPLEVHGAPSLCPLCSGAPLAGVLRPQGDGGRRSLICSLCATEWGFRRILCPACGEEEVDKLPVYVAEELPHVRVEACDTCHGYLKTIDMTKEGRAVPVVDELAAIPLSLWAAERGYEKLHPNLLGV